MDGGVWSESSRKVYNLRDGVARSTIQVLINAVFFFPNMHNPFVFLIDKKITKLNLSFVNQVIPL